MANQSWLNTTYLNIFALISISEQRNKEIRLNIQSTSAYSIYDHVEQNKFKKKSANRQRSSHLYERSKNVSKKKRSILRTKNKWTHKYGNVFWWRQSNTREKKIPNKTTKKHNSRYGRHRTDLVTYEQSSNNHFLLG